MLKHFPINLIIYGKHIKFNLKMNKETKQKIILWLTIIITAINFLLVVAFVVYLYFWVEGRR